MPSQQDGAFRNRAGGVGGLNQCQRPCQLSKEGSGFKSETGGVGGRRWPSKPPHAPTMGLELLGPGTVPRTHPAVSASWPPFLFLGLNLGTLSPFLTCASCPVLLGCPSVPSASPSCPWLGSCLLWCPPETPRAGMGWDSPALDLQPWRPSRHGRGWEIPRFSQRTHPRC